MDYKEYEADEQLEREFKLQLEQWREHYHAIYVSEINDIEFIWRGLSRAEYRKAMEWYDDDYERAEFVCRLCILEPQVDDWAVEIPAGIPETLTQHILEESGFSEGSTKIKQLGLQFDAEMTKFENQVSCIIREVYSEFTLDEIENWPIEKTMWYFSRAKWVLAQLRGVTLEEEETTSAFPGVPKM